MSDIVEDDDNMIVLVVGDEESSKYDPHIQVPCPITIKIEPYDNAVEIMPENEIFKTEKKEIVTKEEYDVEYLEEYNIKDEIGGEPEEYAIEYLEDFPVEAEIHSQSETYEDDGEDDDDEDYSEHEYKKSFKMKLRKRTPKRKKTQRKKRKKKMAETKMPQKKTPKNYVSFVKQLRKTNPEFATNEQSLVKHLAGIMREIRPPTPPENYHEVIEVDEDKKIYQCTLCEVQTETLPCSARHYQFRHGDFYLTCFACGNTYRNTPSLYKHEKRCTAPDAKVVLRARGHHLGRKGRGRPFTTKHKFITASTPDDLKTEEKTRLFCTKCPASFVHRENLVAHENSHEGLRPYSCQHCDISYASYQALRRHRKLHGESQYMCDHCGRAFKLRPSLISHLDSHRPIRKHGCLYCERRFTQKTALRHHMNKVHLNLPAEQGCPVCPKRYARLSHVREHMNKAHGLTLITRKMYARAVPSITDSHLNEIFGRDVDQIINSVKSTKEPEPEHILPDEEEQSKEKYIKVIKKVKVEIDPNPISNETYTSDDDDEYDHHNDDHVDDDDDHDDDDGHHDDDDDDDTDLKATEPTKMDTKKKREIKKETKLKKEKPGKLKPKKKRKLPPRRKVVNTEPPVQVDEEIDDDKVYNIEYKRKRKTLNPARENKKPDDDMHKIVRDIKSTLINKKKVVNIQAEKKKASQNFYEIKRDFMNQLKNEIEIPVEEKTENLVPEQSSSENALKKEPTGDETTDDEEWKTYKDVSEKNKVIADFLEYVKSGVVPKHVPILRRGKQANKKP